MSIPGSSEPTSDEARNGWDAAALAAYRRERAAAFDRVAGNVVTEFKRPRQQARIENAGRSYSPFTRQVR